MIMSTDKPRRLGRGLEALFSARSTAEQLSRSRDDGPPSALRQIPITQIRTNHLQPRKEFNPSELADLEASIRANGLLQPVTVRTVSGGFELIAGERRLRAAQRIGWHEIPALVREIDDKEMLTLALVENLQRTDLNPIEEAEGYQHLVEQFSLTQQQVADVVGKDRSTIANTLRLLVLPSVVRRMVREGRISLGHARALLALGDDHRIVELANLIVKEGLNVRDVEQRVRQAGTKHSRRSDTTKRAGVKQLAEIGRIEDDLRRHLQTDVKVHVKAKDRGELRIAFYSADDLERVLDVVLGASRETA